MSDDHLARILSSIERLRVDVLARIDRLEAGSKRHADLAPAQIIAHVQNVGDIEGKLGDWIGERRSGHWIEGFRIAPPLDIASSELLYRAVLGRDQLSTWTPSGRFCGSEGLGLPLRGLCLALGGEAAAKYECSYTATFVDGSVAGLLPVGHVCAAATWAPLEAFQIVLHPRPR